MLKIKDNIDLKELEKFGFKELKNDPRGHKYSWREEKGNWFYEVYVARNNRISIYIETFEPFRYIRMYSKLQTKIYELTRAGLLEEIE